MPMYNVHTYVYIICTSHTYTNSSVILERVLHTMEMVNVGCRHIIHYCSEFFFIVLLGENTDQTTESSIIYNTQCGRAKI